MKRLHILHPVLFVLWALLFSYVRNVELLLFREVVFTIVAGVGATLGLWGLWYLLLRNGRKAALLTSFFVVTFFSYGQLTTPFNSAGPVLKLLFWAGLVVGFTIFVVRSRRPYDLATRVLNFVALVLLGLTVGLWLEYRFSLAPVAVAQTEHYIAEWEAETERFDTTTCRAARALPRPDIYYLILDGFGRADVLRDLYQMDLDGWIDGLKQTGFYVADRSTANYGQTMLSLASALNVTYVNELASQVDHQSANRLPLEVMLEENRVFQFLRCAGYHLVYFPTGYVSVDIVAGVDQSVTPPGSPDSYQMELIGTTPVPDLLEVVLQKTPRDYYRARMLYTFDHLKDATRLDGPVFVMAHVLAPHPPFVFGAQGEPLEAKDHQPLMLIDGSWFTAREGRGAYVQAYRDQASFIADQTQAAVAEILASATRPTIIVVQGDHGPGSMVDWNSPENTNFRERMPILNAYYFPDQNYAALYPTITPVNTFRVILNQYLGASYPLLEDRSYFSIMDRPYALLDVTDEVQTMP